MKKVYIFNTHTHTHINKQTTSSSVLSGFCISVLLARVLTVDNVPIPFDHKMDNTKLQCLFFLLLSAPSTVSSCHTSFSSFLPQLQHRQCRNNWRAIKEGKEKYKHKVKENFLKAQYKKNWEGTELMSVHQDTRW